MDTIGRKTPVPLTFTGWQALPPAEAAREVHARVAALPNLVRSAALAWLRPERELAEELGLGSVQNVGASLLATQSPPVASKVAPTPEAAASANAPLHGVPYFLKDLFDFAGVPTRAGSTFLDRVRPTPAQDSRIVQQLRELGATCAGKTHLVEFASGLTGENPHFGDCPHPRFPDRLTGGSSSGSAALVAAGVAPLAIGTDTGGSIRVPAAFCGLFGFRLTPGDALVRDAFPLAPTMDTAGWFTANAPDMLTVAQSLIGLPPADSAPRGCWLPGRSLVATIDPEVDAACEAAAARLGPRADAATEAALLASWREAVDAYVTIGMSEAHTVHRDWLAPYREHYDPVIWQRFADAGRYPPGKIAAARSTLAQVRSVWAQFFQGYDFLVLPSAPCAAPTKAECTADLRRSILALTAPASLGGLPCVCLPVTLAGGLTAGLQVIAKEPHSPVFAWVLEQ